MSVEVLGVDVGGVIIDKVNDNTDTSFFGDNYLQTTATLGVFEALQRLVSERFGEHVHLVSKCGKRVQEKTLRWLDHHQFYERTGIGREHVYFCLERHEKAGICRRLGVTHFIDDRLEVLGSLQTVGNLYLFQPNPREVRRHAQFLDRVRQVQSWDGILRELLATN